MNNKERKALAESIIKQYKLTKKNIDSYEPYKYLNFHIYFCDTSCRSAIESHFLCEFDGRLNNCNCESKKLIPNQLKMLVYMINS